MGAVMTLLALPSHNEHKSKEVAKKQGNKEARHDGKREVEREGALEE
jgi:hypothetical protein